MTAKAVNLTDDAKQAIRDDGNVDTLETSTGKYILKHKTLSWGRVATEASEREEYESTRVNLTEKLPGHPKDSIVCCARALEKHFGPIQWGEVISFPTDAYGGKQDVPKSTFEIPEVPIKMRINFGGVLEFSFPNKLRHIIDFIIKICNEEIAKRSIFRGTAIRISENGSIDFFPTEGDTDTLVFAPKVERELRACIVNRIVKRETRASLGIPLKAGVLLEGEYGTGKTAFALKIAQLCTTYNQTFIYCKTPRYYEYALAFVGMYPGLTIFIEDLDRLIEENEADEIVNALDAVDTKASDTLFIFTTNHLDKIREKMPKLTRPGRIDHLIRIKLPAGPERIRLFKLYVPVPVLGSISQAIEQTDGCNAAAIKQICHRALQFADYDGCSVAEEIPAEYINDAAESYRDYLDAISPAEKKVVVNIDDLVKSKVVEAIRETNGAE